MTKAQYCSLRSLLHAVIAVVAFYGVENEVTKIITLAVFLICFVTSIVYDDKVAREFEKQEQSDGTE